MEIIQSDTSRQITITDEIIEGYKYLHAIVRVSTQVATLFDSKITISSSEFKLTTDGLYYIVSIKLPLYEEIITSPTSNIFYIVGEVIFKEGEGNKEYTVVELLNLDSEVYDFGNAKVTNFIMFKYDLVKSRNALVKYLSKLGTCEIDECASNLKDTLDMGISVINLLVTNSKWNTANQIIEKLHICGGSNINLSKSCNCG